MAYRDLVGLGVELRRALGRVTGTCLDGCHDQALVVFAQSRGLDIAVSQDGVVEIAGQGIFSSFDGLTVEALGGLLEQGFRACLTGDALSRVSFSADVFGEAAGTWRLLVDEGVGAPLDLPGLSDAGVDDAIRRLRKQVAHYAMAQTGVGSVAVDATIIWPWDREQHRVSLVEIKAPPGAGAVLVAKSGEGRVQVIQSDFMNADDVTLELRHQSGEPDMWVGSAASVLERLNESFLLGVPVLGAHLSGDAPDAVVGRVAFPCLAYERYSDRERNLIRRGFDSALSNVTRGFSALLCQQAVDGTGDAVSPEDAVYRSAVFSPAAFPGMGREDLSLVRQGWQDAVAACQRALRDASRASAEIIPLRGNACVVAEHGTGF